MEINLSQKNNMNEDKAIAMTKMSLKMTKNVMFGGELSTFSKYVISL